MEEVDTLKGTEKKEIYLLISLKRTTTLFLK
jgi:hypothetical protein